MTKVLIVGINPSNSKSVKPCITLKRLYRWADELGLQFFSFVNCISRPGSYTFKDVEFDLLSECVKGYDKVIALGGFPSKALQKMHISHYAMPHPSGLNRRLNDKQYEKHVIGECDEYLRS
jgi:hypothetical protein